MIHHCSPWNYQRSTYFLVGARRIARHQNRLRFRCCRACHRRNVSGPSASVWTERGPVEALSRRYLRSIAVLGERTRAYRGSSLASAHKDHGTSKTMTDGFLGEAEGQKSAPPMRRSSGSTSGRYQTGNFHNPSKNLGPQGWNSCDCKAAGFDSLVGSSRSKNLSLERIDFEKTGSTEAIEFAACASGAQRNAIAPRYNQGRTCRSYNMNLPNQHDFRETEASSRSNANWCARTSLVGRTSCTRGATAPGCHAKKGWGERHRDCGKSTPREQAGCCRKRVKGRGDSADSALDPRNLRDGTQR